MECISTHAPRTGSDRFIPMRITRGGNFNPRSPHGERRTVFVMPCVVAPTFQPTLPARGATGAALPPPSARGISTHAPRTGSDRSTAVRCLHICGFQPTLPARGATKPCPFCGKRKIISTHAPRTGSDGYNAIITERWTLYFNPRSPHGERPRFR